MDMNRSYSSLVLQVLPGAKPMIDRFHVSQLFQKLVDDASKHNQNKIHKEEGNKRRYSASEWHF